MVTHQSDDLNRFTESRRKHSVRRERIDVASDQRTPFHPGNEKSANNISKSWSGTYSEDSSVELGTCQRVSRLVTRRAPESSEQLTFLTIDENVSAIDQQAKEEDVLEHPADTNELVRHEGDNHPRDTRMLILESEFLDGGVDGDVSWTQRQSHDHDRDEEVFTFEILTFGGGFEEILESGTKGVRSGMREGRCSGLLLVTPSNWKTIGVDASGENRILRIVLVFGIVGTSSPGNSTNAESESDSTVRCELSVTRPEQRRRLSTTSVKQFSSLSSGRDYRALLLLGSIGGGDVSLRNEGCVL